MKTAILKRDNTRNFLIVGALLLLLWYALTPTIATALYGIGDLLSERLIESPLPASRLTIGPTILVNIQSVAMGPRVATLSPIDVRMTDTTYATLRGEVLSMNIDPVATVWFEWSYNPNLYHAETVGLQTVTSPGIYSVTITGQTPGTIYYRFVAKGGDGTNLGGIYAFTQPGALWWRTAEANAIVFGAVVLVSLLILATAGTPVIPMIITALMIGAIGTVGLSILTSLLLALK